MNSASAAATVIGAASKAQTFANQTVETARFEVLKEPLGFMKLLQFILAILAFAIAVNGGNTLAFAVTCTVPAGNPAQPGSAYFQADYGYPYDVSKTQIYQTNSCPAGQNISGLDRNTITKESNNIVPSSQFFVFNGVAAFLYSLAFTIIYVFFRHRYDNNVYIPLVDFIATVLFTLFWFCASIAWAKAIGDIQNYTNPDTVIETLPVACAKGVCQGKYYPTYANMVVSCILGFGNLILWAGDVWFVLKETSWYKTRKQLQQQQQNVTNNPISPSGVTISAQYNPNNKI